MGFGSRLARKGHIVISLFDKFLYLNLKKPLTVYEYLERS